MKEIWFSLIASTCLLSHLPDSLRYPIQEQIIIRPVSGFNVLRHCYCRNESMDSRRGAMTGSIEINVLAALMLQESSVGLNRSINNLEMLHKLGRAIH